MKKSDIEELREYRRLKASGRLLIIPEGISDGDTVYLVEPEKNRVSSHMLIEWLVFGGRLLGKIALDDDYYMFAPEEIGYVIFTDKAEADERLRDIREKYYPDPEEEEGEECL